METSAEIEPVTTGTWQDMRGESVLDRYTEFLEPTRYTPRDRELPSKARALKKGNSPSDAVLAASEWVWEQLKYQPGSTGVHSSVVDAWRERKGVCQDFAHLSLVLLRAMGIPVGPRHVWVALGRDYADVAPLKGSTRAGRRPRWRSRSTSPGSLDDHQGSGPWAEKKPPVGPSGPVCAMRTMISAPSSTVCVPVFAFRSVLV